MWEAARDLALDNPTVPCDVLMRLMTGRRGAGAPAPLPAARRALRGAARGDGQRPGDRDLRRRHLPLGRERARRRRGVGAPAGGGGDGRLHPQRRDAARRVPAHGAERAARLHAARHRRRGAAPAARSSTGCSRARCACSPRSARACSARKRAPTSPPRSPAIATPPGCSSASTRSKRRGRRRRDLTASADRRKCTVHGYRGDAEALMPVGIGRRRTHWPEVRPVPLRLSAV